MTGKQTLFANSYIDKGSKTFLNGTESALAAYNTENRDRASEIAHQNLQKAPITNYIEQKAVELGIGMQVRLQNYGEIANAQKARRTTTRKYARNDEGTLMLVAKVVTDTPVKDSDRVKAMHMIDVLSGTKEQREIDKQHAMSEYDELYDRMVGNRARAIEKKAAGSSNIEETDKLVEKGHPAGEPGPGGKGSHVSSLSSSSLTSEANSGSGKSVSGGGKKVIKKGIGNEVSGVGAGKRVIAPESDEVIVRRVGKSVHKAVKKQLGYYHKDVIRSILEGI